MREAERAELDSGASKKELSARLISSTPALHPLSSVSLLTRHS